MPSGIQAGDLLLLFADHKSQSTFTASGWTVLFFVGNTLNGVECWWKKAVGSDTLTVTITVNNTNSNYNCYRITGAADPDTQAPEAATSSSSNPPNLSPTGGSKEYLWVTALGSSNGGNGSPPTNYGNELSSRGGGLGMESARRTLTAASENPGAWGTPGNDPRSATVAIHPISDPTVVVTGTFTNDSETEIRAGGSTVILTMENGTWVAAGATFNAERQGIIDGMDSAGTDAGGWDAKVIPTITVGDVVRTSDTVVTITLPAVPLYDIEADETITITVPASAVDSFGSDVVVTPTVTLINATEGDFPVVEGSTNSGQGASGTSVTVDLPSGIVAGELLLVYVGSDGPQTDIAFPAGWTRVNFTEHTNSDGAQALGYRVADGNEGANITVTLNSSRPTTHISHRLTNFRNPTIQAPEVAVAQSGVETNTPDPPNLVPTGGSKDYLWFAFGTEFSGNDFTAIPSSYTNSQLAASGTSSAGGGQRELFASSENPGTFTLAAGADWQTMTVAIHPAYSIQAAGFLWRPRTQERLLLLE